MDKYIERLCPSYVRFVYEMSVLSLCCFFVLYLDNFSSTKQNNKYTMIHLIHKLAHKHLPHTNKCRCLTHAEQHRVARVV